MQRQWHSSKDEKGVKQGNKTRRAFQRKKAMRMEFSHQACSKTRLRAKSG